MSLILVGNNGTDMVFYQVAELSKDTLDSLAASYDEKDRAIVYTALAKGYTPGQAIALAAYAAPNTTHIHNLLVLD